MNSFRFPKVKYILAAIKSKSSSWKVIDKYYVGNDIFRYIIKDSKGNRRPLSSWQDCFIIGDKVKIKISSQQGEYLERIK